MYQIVKLYLDHSLNFEVMSLISLSDLKNLKATHGSMISCNFTMKEVPYWMFKRVEMCVWGGGGGGGRKQRFKMTLKAMLVIILQIVKRR